MAIHITELRTTDGHLRDVPLRLSEGLNCIIGARGTCKSTIVETIRFLFNDDPNRVAQLLSDAGEHEGPAHQGLIHATLKGGTAHLRLGDSSGQFDNATIERDATSEEPTVYVDGVVVIEDPDLLRKVEIYSQGELQSIATDPPKRLELVDRPNKSEIGRWLDEIDRVCSQIAEIGLGLREVNQSIEASETSLTEGEPITAQLDQVRQGQPELPAEISDLRVAHQGREALQRQAEGILAEYREGAEALQVEAERLAAVARRGEELRGSGNSELEEITASLTESAEALEGLSSSTSDPNELEALLAKAKEAFAAASASYYEALREEKAVTESLKLEDRLAEEAKKLERVADDLAKHRAGATRLLAERKSLRARVRELRDKIYELRLAEVEGINAKFADDIVLTLRQGAQTRLYRERLDSLLEGSRLRERPKLCAELAASLPPDALVDIVEREDSTTLAKTLERDPGQMVRLVSHLANSEDIFHLESEVPDDELDVTMYVEGQARSVSEMSKGQQATAILPLVLRPAAYPLVLDQPEDDLDNRFIFKTLVQKVKALKAERQLIFVTHNANIPVIGDAEQVLVMGMSGPEQAEAIGVGSVEEMRGPIIEILEGGRSAFELRSKSYGLADN